MNWAHDVGVSLEPAVLTLRIYPGEAQEGEICSTDNTRLRLENGAR